MKVIKKIYVKFSHFFSIEKITHQYYFRWLKKHYCNGTGVEIGPGENPYLGNNKNNHFVDLFPPKTELNNFINSDASKIPVDDNFFDFLISAHCLEHCVDPIKVLNEWKRIIKKKGKIILILPHCERTFDKKRKKSNINNHINDFNNAVCVDDYINEDGSHRHILEESAEVSFENFNHSWEKKARIDEKKWDFKWLSETGNIHYHVWTQNEIIDLLSYVDFKIVYCNPEVPGRHDSFIVVGQK